MKIASIVTAFILPFAASSVAAQDDMTHLAASSHWNLDYAEESCALRRIFGDEGKKVFLELRQYSPGGSLQVSVLSDDLRSRVREPQLTFEPELHRSENQSVTLIESERWGDGILANMTLNRQLPPETIEAIANGEFTVETSDGERDAREKEIEGLRLQGVFRDNVLLQTGSMHPPMTALRSCMDELLTHWGIDAEAHRTLSRSVNATDVEEWSRELQRRYPSRMLMRGEQAALNIRLNVSEDGTPTTCVVQSRLNNEAFDELACDVLLKHSKFEPALDASGAPIASYFIQRISYQMFNISP